MANAKIVDIKGVQWELKDEVARNRIAELENKVYIVEEDMQSQNKYRKWSDGLLEQWFTITKTMSKNSMFFVDFPIAFDDIPIELNCTIKGIYGQSPLGLIAVSNDYTMTKSGVGLSLFSEYNYTNVNTTILIAVKGFKKE